MNYCKQLDDVPKDGILVGLEKNRIIELKDLITEKLEKGKLKSDLFSLTQYKLYDYSQENIQHSKFDITNKKFIMSQLQKYNLTITQSGNTNYDILIE